MDNNHNSKSYSVDDLVRGMAEFVNNEEQVAKDIPKEDMERMRLYSEAVDSLFDLAVKTGEDDRDSLATLYFMVNSLALRYFNCVAETSNNLDDYCSDVTHLLMMMEATSIFVGRNTFS